MDLLLWLSGLLAGLALAILPALVRSFRPTRSSLPATRYSP